MAITVLAAAVLFAEEGAATAGDVGWAVMWVTAGGGFVAAVAAAYISVFKARHAARMEQATAAAKSKTAADRSKAEANREAISHWKEIADRQDTHIEELQKEAARSRVAELTCQQELLDLRGYVVILWDSYRRQYNAAKARGEDVGPALPDPPSRSPRAAITEAVFVKRQQEHTTGLIRREKEDSVEPPPASETAS